MRKTSHYVILLLIGIIGGTLLSFPLFAEEARFLKVAFPDGFALQENVQFYSPKNLFEYIDGQATFYLSYGFEKLEHGLYKYGDDMLSLDVYKLGSRLAAFGVYRQQKEEGPGDLGIGCESAISNELAVFYKGVYYVEIIPLETEHDNQEMMRLLANNVEKLIPGETDIPSEVALFPREGLITGSERYVDEALLGYSFMGRGLTAQYNLPDEKGIRVFIALADNNQKAQVITKEYKKKMENISPVTTDSFQGVKGKEPYRGIVILGVCGSYVFGCLDMVNEQHIIPLLNTLYNNLKID
jgi:hypothetical protein